MTSALALSAPPALATLLESEGAALFLDFDGTLVELAAGPDAIKPVSQLADRLAALEDRLEGRCAVVSGRSIADIERHLGPLAIAIAGSHGSDIRSASGQALGDAAKSLPAQIESELRSFASENDIDYEHKAHGGALHYRRNPHQGELAEEFARALAAKHGWKAQRGKCVIEIVSGHGDKGSAVHTFMESSKFKGAKPFFIGDDLTDEAGFAACGELGGAGILVGKRDTTLARYHLRDVASVHDWLEI